MKKIHNFYLLLFVTGIILISRLFYLQFYLKKHLSKNSVPAYIRKKIIIPSRGYIYDRNKKLLVSNKPIYELTIIPYKMQKSFNKTEFIKLLGISEDVFEEKLKKAKKYSLFKPSSFLTNLDINDYCKIQEKLYKFNGFYWIKRFLRDYKVNISAKLFGHIGQISPAKLKIESDYYNIGDLVGVSGVEKSYESVLRGNKGVIQDIVDSKGRIMDSFINEGKKKSKKAKRGQDIYLSIDWSLQEYIDKLMHKKKGGVVAIDPKTGEILALVSTPSVDPNIFLGKKHSEEIVRLYQDNVNKPLFDKTTNGLYSPGSTFKILIELAALQMGSVDVNTEFMCQQGFVYGNKKMKCHCNIYGRPKRLETAIAVSCNSYFAQAYLKSLSKYRSLTKSVDEWNRIIKSFGLGDFLNTDLATGQKGRIPDSDYYDKQYGTKKWNALTTLSNSIGQGEISITPLQLANVMVAIANRGFFYTPHIVKAIGDITGINSRYTYRRYTQVEAKHFEAVIRGMQKVFLSGTAYKFRVPDISMAGKTGTVENFARVNNKRVSLKDHSIFTLFAPVKNPKIVIAIMVENGSWGSELAAPIGSLIAEKYINNQVKRKTLEHQIMNNNLDNVYNNINNLKYSEGKN